METIALDIHTHLIPVQDAAVVASEGVWWDAGSSSLTIDGHAVGVKRLFSPSALLEWLSSNRIGAAYVSAPPPLYRQHLAEEASAQWFARVHDGLVAQTQVDPSRLTALPHLPIEHPDLAVQIAGDAVRRGITRFSAPSGAPGRMLSEKAYESLWRVLNDGKAFVLIHPGEATDERLAPFYLGNLLGNPYETTVAIAHLVFGGIVARFPDITFCFAHAGGAAAMLAGRFQKGFETDRPGVDRSLPAPRSLLKRLAVDCIAHDREAFRLTQSIFGASRIVFGSDWPFPMGLLDPHAQLSELSPDDRAAIFQGNNAAVVG
ncbi:amidohydrolase family protein [Bradyrhizobium sp. CCBAU 53338]|uniref:amidohydrolase family protein n=1 Tax=Bradyrhizobium sp. CCBAU 53338 TaxID=1325111 RepID=UPI00188A0922|nr:amidohydrolase family protein [Bradyrhizobium sp. CCBAU 53338]